MTEWYQPKQMEVSKKWHYTCSNSVGTFPIGACAADCPGHDTAAGAVRHYADGLAAGELRAIDDEAEQRKCVVCGAWTQHRVLLWGAPHFMPLAICESHDPRPALKADVYKHYNVEAL